MDEPQSKNLIPINICTFAIKIVPRLNIISGSATGHLDCPLFRDTFGIGGDLASTRTHT
jgi:hypothetical protein